jgi:hypothetical protein
LGTGLGGTRLGGVSTMDGGVPVFLLLAIVRLHMCSCLPIVVVL